jgi:hypothetical protein
MNQASPTAELSQSDHAEWEDIEDIASHLFHVWVSGGDLAWAKTAWQALSQAGMTAHTSEAERTICVVRLVALSALYREFCVRAFDEGESDEWREAITNDLVGDYPLLDVFTLGQLAERRQINVDNSPLYESDPPVLDYVVLELVKDEYRNVVDTLKDQWGESAFFASLYISAESDEDEDDEDEEREVEASSPVIRDQIDRVMIPDSGRGAAHAWFSEGLPL